MKQIIAISEMEDGRSHGPWGVEQRPLQHPGENSTRWHTAESPPQRGTILLADDDVSVLQMLGRILESEHYTVVRAKTGREAAALFLSDRPDLVLLDLTMPEKDGWEAFHLIDTVDPMTPVIIITARPNQYEQATRMGADALMEKPLDLMRLLDTIDTFLAESEAERKRRITNPGFKTLDLTQRMKPA